MTRTASAPIYRIAYTLKSIKNKKTMKQTTDNRMRQTTCLPESYLTPSVEVHDIRTERGFAQSPEGGGITGAIDDYEDGGTEHIDIY